MYKAENTKTIWLHNPKTGGTFLRHRVLEKNSRSTVMLNWAPYNREVNTDMGHVNMHHLRRFVPDCDDYRIITFVRNPYDRYVSFFNSSINNSAYIKNFYSQLGNDPLKFAEFVQKSNYITQDRILRNPEIPWLNPQSFYLNEKVEVLRYECLEDWNKAGEWLDFSTEKLVIKPPYEVKPELLEVLKEIYWEDAGVFKLYNL